MKKLSLFFLFFILPLSAFAQYSLTVEITGLRNNKGDILYELFYGTHELFYPDCKKLKKITQALDNFTFEEFPEMQHDWVIFPIPESTEALNLAIEFINK